MASVMAESRHTLSPRTASALEKSLGGAGLEARSMPITLGIGVWGHMFGPARGFGRRFRAATDWTGMTTNVLIGG